MTISVEGTRQSQWRSLAAGRLRSTPPGGFAEVLTDSAAGSTKMPIRSRRHGRRRLGGPRKDLAGHKRRLARGRRGRARRAWMKAACASPKAGALAGASMAEKGGAAVVRLNDMYEIPGGPVDPERGAAKWWDKVPSKCRLVIEPLPRRRVPRRARRDRVSLSRYRTERRADAELRQCRRPCR